MPRSELTPRARDLRANHTRAEAMLWSALRNRQLGGWKWRRQVPVGPYIVDFICADRGLVIEIDGGQHSEAVAYDERRTAYLEKAGLTVLRFWNHYVIESRGDACDAILRACGGEASPPPPPSRSAAP